MEDTDTTLAKEEAAAALMRDDGIGLLVVRAFSFDIPPLAASFARNGGRSAMTAGRIG